MINHWTQGHPSSSKDLAKTGTHDTAALQHTWAHLHTHPYKRLFAVEHKKKSTHTLIFHKTTVYSDLKLQKGQISIVNSKHHKIPLMTHELYSKCSEVLW